VHSVSFMPGKIVLWGAYEIRARLGYSREWTQRLIGRRDFPEPAANPRMGALWWPEDVERWIVDHRPELIDGPAASDPEG
jgi:prophage regulatory protein